MPESQPRDSDSYLVKVAGIVKVNTQPGLGVTAFRQAFQPDKLFIQHIIGTGFTREMG